jgi:hypothetical protein
VAKAKTKTTTPDDWKALVEANASLMEARDGDRRRLESRQSDKSVVLTLEEREFLAAPAPKRRAHRPERLSTRLMRELAKQVLNTALRAKAQWQPGYTIANLIDEVQAQSGLCRSDAFKVYKLVKMTTRRS